MSEGFVAGLCWQNLEPGQRRNGFPSWSWTGWTAPLSPDADEYKNGLSIGTESKIEVSAELCDRSLLPWQDFWQSNLRKRSIEKLSQYIHLEAWTVPLQFNFFPSTADKHPQYLPSELKPTMGSPYWAIFKDGGKINALLRLYLLLQTDEGSDFHLTLTMERFVGIILGRSQDLSRDSNTFILVAQNQEDYFERIGHLIFGRGHLKVVPESLREWDPDTLPWELCFRQKERQHIRLR